MLSAATSACSLGGTSELLGAARMYLAIKRSLRSWLSTPIFIEHMTYELLGIGRSCRQIKLPLTSNRGTPLHECQLLDSSQRHNSSCQRSSTQPITAHKSFGNHDLSHCLCQTARLSQNGISGPDCPNNINRGRNHGQGPRRSVRDRGRVNTGWRPSAPN